MKKILLIIMCGIFLINLASAFNWNDNSLVAYYNFNEGTGTWLNDSTGNGNNGTLINTPIWVDGILEGALNFSNSSSQYVNFTATDDFAIIGNNNFSLSFWIYPNSSSGQYVIVGKQDNWYIQQNGLKLSVLFEDDNDNAYHNSYITDNDVLNTGTWQHIAFSYNGTGDFENSGAILAVNGTIVPITKTWLHGGTANNSGNFKIGKHPALTGRNFNGGIDELGFWGAIFSMTNITELYNEGIGLEYFIPSININDEIFPLPYYETETMTNGRFFINISNNSYTDLNATFVYNSTIFTTTKNTSSGFFTFERNITHIFDSDTDIPYYWNFTIINTTGTYYLTYANGASSSVQIVYPIIFTLCNSPYITSFLNFSFKDESTLNNMNGTIQSASFTYWIGDGDLTKTYTYSTSDNFSNYSFCASPSSKTFYVIPYINYLAESYPNRIYQPGTLTSTTTNKILYLLGAAEGIYVTFITATEANTPISGASITIIRTISGTNATLSSGTTDAAGSFTAWLNPNYDHYITAGKTGYGITTQIIRPTQSTYTIILSSGVSSYTFINDYDGLKWFVFPSVGSRNLAAATNFGFNISAENDNLLKCKIELLNKNKTVVLSSAETITTNASECSVYTSYIMTDADYNIKGRLLVDIGEGYQLLEDDAYWAYLPYNRTNSTLTDWFTELKGLDLSYFNNNEQHREYTYILLFFLFVTLVCAVMNYSGWDIQTAGGMIYLVGILIFLASIPGFLNLSGISPFSWMDKYFVALVYSMFMIGFTTRNFT